MRTSVQASEDLLVGSVYAGSCGAFVYFIAVSWMWGGIAFVVLLMTLLAASVIFSIALLNGIVLQHIEREYISNPGGLLALYILVACLESVVIGSEFHNQNLTELSSWRSRYVLQYIPLGVAAAIGAWYSVVFRTHNKQINQGLG